MPLLFNKTGLAGAIGHGLVLEWTFATLIAHWAVERMIHKEEFKNALLGSLSVVGFGVYDHPLRNRGHARWLQHRPATGIDIDETHPAHAHR
jgi:hypothetical protein